MTLRLTLFSIFIIAATITGEARAAAPSYFVSISDAHGDASWSRSQCAFIHGALTLSRREGVTTACGLASNGEASEARASGQYRYHVQATREQDGKLRLGVENWSPERDETDFDKLGWKIETSEPGEQRLETQKLLARFHEFDRSQRAIKELALVQGSADSKVISVGADGNYVEKATGQAVEFSRAYALYRNESDRHKHYLRATLEIFGELAAGFGWYWRNADFNAVDWELKWDWASWRRKLVTGTGIDFDTNQFNTNATSHPKAGTMYYMFARQNNLNPLESFLMAAAASTVWEYTVEFKEKVSINDLIVTPVAGMAIGETFTQLGEFFDRGRNTFINRTISAIFAPPRAFHNFLDKNSPRRDGDFDRFGFTKEMFHSFQLFAGHGLSKSSQEKGVKSVEEFGLETELVNVPTYNKPGHVSTLLSDGNFSKLIVRLATSDNQVRDFKFFTQAALAGYYKQSIERGDDGNLKGYSFYIGAGTAFEYASHERDSMVSVGDSTPLRKDLLGIVNVLGPTMDLVFHRDGLTIHAKLDLYPNFAMVRSYAVEKWTSKNSNEGIKSVLREQGYYYAFGVEMAPKVTAAWKGFELGGELKFDFFTSIEGKDRYPEKVTHDVSLTDSRMSAKAWLSYTLPGDWLKISASVQRYSRSGSIGEVSDSRTETTWMGDLTFLF